jgi:hypothetical protein
MQLTGSPAGNDIRDWHIAPLRDGVRDTKDHQSWTWISTQSSKRFDTWMAGMAGRMMVIEVPYHGWEGAWEIALAFELEEDWTSYQLSFPDVQRARTFRMTMNIDLPDPADGDDT